MQSIQSIPSVWPFRHMPPSEIGSSSFSNCVLYDLTGTRVSVIVAPGLI
jgi:hypothetical protein